MPQPVARKAVASRTPDVVHRPPAGGDRAAPVTAPEALVLALLDARPAATAADLERAGGSAAAARSLAARGLVVREELDADGRIETVWAIADAGRALAGKTAAVRTTGRGARRAAAAASEDGGVPKLGGLVPWFGAARRVAAFFGEQTRGCKWVGVPFCGSMAEVPAILAAGAREVVVNDAHRGLINLARVTAHPEFGPLLWRRLRRQAFAPETLADAQLFCSEREPDESLLDLEHAVRWFVCAWAARSANAGTVGELDGKLSVRWDSGGGSSALRFSGAAWSIREWRKVLARCAILSEDGFDFLARCKDEPSIGVYCFLPGSKIRLVNEDQIKVESARPGDVIAPGKTVLRTFTRRYVGEAVRITLGGFVHPMSVTPEHPVMGIKRINTRGNRDRRTADELYSARELLEAGRIEVGDRMMVPCGGHETPAFPFVEKLLEAYRAVRTGRRHHQRKRIVLRDCAELYSFLGYYAAEGHCGRSGRPDSGGITLSFGIHETDTLADHARYCIKEAFGLDSVVAPGKPHRSVTSVRCGSVELGFLVQTLVGGVARTKQFADVLMTAPTENQIYILSCWLLGDGGVELSSDSKARVTGTTTSEMMAHQLFTMSIRCGLRPRLAFRDDSYGGGYRLRLSSVDAESIGYPVQAVTADKCWIKKSNGHLLVPVTKVDRFNYSGPVYNLETDGDHLFCAPFALSHNCDPPWPGAGTAYKHSFGEGRDEEAAHRRLAATLNRFERTRVVLRTGGDDLTRDLYSEADGWTWLVVDGRDQANARKAEFAVVRNRPADG